MSAATVVLLGAVHWIGGLVILCEAINKLERTSPKLPAASPRQRLVVALKLAGWYLLAIGAGGALAAPLFSLRGPALEDVAVIAGFATLIVRSRLKEKLPP